MRALTENDPSVLPGLVAILLDKLGGEATITLDDRERVLDGRHGLDSEDIPDGLVLRVREIAFEPSDQDCGAAITDPGDDDGGWR